jgi:hypothetical protein
VIAVIGTIGSAGSTLAFEIARSCVASGAPAELIGVVPPGNDGDRRIVELGRAGIGHAAVLRSPALKLDAADLALALRYLPDTRVILAIDLEAALVAVAAEAAAFAGAALVVLTGETAAPDGLPEEAVVIQVPRSDDGMFAGFVARLAGRLDAGVALSEAWAGTVDALAVDALSPE